MSLWAFLELVLPYLSWCKAAWRSSSSSLRWMHSHLRRTLVVQGSIVRPCSCNHKCKQSGMKEGGK